MNESRINEIIAFCQGSDGIPNEGEARCAMQDLFAQRGQDELYAVWTAIRDNTRARRRFIWAAFNLLDVDSGVHIAAVTILKDHNEREQVTMQAAWDSVATREAALYRRRHAILRQCKKLRKRNEDIQVALGNANRIINRLWGEKNDLEQRIMLLELDQSDLRIIRQAFRLLTKETT